MFPVFARRVVVANAPPAKFQYGFDPNPINISGIGGFTLTTEFTLDCSVLVVPCPYILTVELDGGAVASTLLMLRR